MQELRIVLIVVGVLAIAGLLIHGLWTNRREQSGKFSDKPLGKLETESTDSAPAEETVAKQEIADDDFEVVKKVLRAVNKSQALERWTMIILIRFWTLNQKQLQSQINKSRSSLNT
ncbi:cell division protein ZipA [Vibrio ishigakensis]|uniref:Cell division protein ZipA n=1 Tax=Vibrio ishigakensis TaxID=1481914 RepID=A0A0B8PGX8_9VIBR|nr:cell division protein ZipA [Vibrio ishigakensis]